MSGVHMVVGGAGYVGSLLVERLVSSGKRVRIFDIQDAAVPAGVETVKADIRNPGLVQRALDGVDVVYHAVGLFAAARDRRELFDVHVGGTRNVLDAAKHAHVRKVVHLSSSAVYGVPELNPVDDFTPFHPRDSYGKARLAAERVCLDYASQGLDVSIIRPRTIMGPGRLGIMQILFEWVRQGRNIPVLGHGDNLYQFLHVNDLIAACLLAGECKEPAIFNLGAERFGTMREALEALCAHAKTGSRVIAVPASGAVGLARLTSSLGLVSFSKYQALMYGRAMHFSLARPKRVLHWTPRYSNEEMFVESYDRYLEDRQQGLTPRLPTVSNPASSSSVLEVASRALSAF